MSRKWWVIAVGAAALFVAAYLGSPFWAVRQFRGAAVSSDVDRLEASVDFPAVRESLKAQLTIALTAKMSNDPEMKANPFAGLGAMLIPTVVGNMVESFVTPQGIAAMMKQGKVQKDSTPSKVEPDVSYSYDYRGLDRFSVTVKRPDGVEASAPKFIFERRGLFSWKMIRLELPDDLLKEA